MNTDLTGVRQNLVSLLNERSIQMATAELPQAPFTRLSNGVVVANFCDDSVSTFNDGNVLDACEFKRASALTPKHRVVAGPGKKNCLDLSTVYESSDLLVSEMKAMDARTDIDIVLVSVPVMEALVSFGFDMMKCKARTRCFDKITNTVRIDQYGTGLKKVVEPTSMDK